MAAPKDGLCRACRMLQTGPTARRTYRWTPAQDEMLRLVYAEASGRAELYAGLDGFVRRTSLPRAAALKRAQQLGISYAKRRAWTPAEIEFLENNAGTRRVDLLARVLKRSYWSVQNRIWEMGRSQRVTEGYSQREFADVMGVAPSTVARWIDRGLLRLGGRGFDPSRVSEAQAESFLRNHSAEYDLRRVDQAWFKGMLFGGFGVKFDPKRATNRVDECEAAC